MFNPGVQRAAFDRYLLQLMIDTDPASRPNPGLAATNTLQTVVYAWLVGLHDEIAPVLGKCLRALVVAEAQDEPSGNQQYRAEARSLADWMNTGRSDPNLSVVAKQRWLNFFNYGKPVRPDDHPLSAIDLVRTRKQTLSKSSLAAGSLASYLAACIQCGAYAEGVAFCAEIQYGDHDDPRKHRNETHFALWYCKQAMTNTTFDYATVGAAMLRRQMNLWLANGRGSYAALWLKLVLAGSATIQTPLETILHAYDYLPDIKRPEYVMP